MQVSDGLVQAYQRRYPLRLNFYTLPPASTVKVEEVEVWALERLQVLKALESALLRSKNDEDIRKGVDSTLHAYLPLALNHKHKDVLFSQRQKDHVSHFILRLAFSKTAESRAWFLRYETLLFRLRFLAADPGERQNFIRELPEFHQTPLTSSQKEQLRPLLTAASQHIRDIDQEQFFVVDFQQVVDLVQRRQVLVRGGKAYVPAADQSILVVNEFKKRLDKALVLTSRILMRLDEEDRLGPILDNLSSQQASLEYQARKTTDAITAADVDTGIGVSLDEALVYWRKAFRHISDDKFHKEYAYNIRHNYGMEGKRANYAPYSCAKIISANHPGPGDYHGCPYRHFSKDQLQSALHQQGLSEMDVRDIADLAHKGHCQLACTRQFEVTHKVGFSGVTHGAGSHVPNSNAQANTVGDSGQDLPNDRIIHPNQYYDQSVVAMGSK
ncbi:DNA primase subunit pri2 [Dispira simplex]|nr:DNA primase subunit pri2 [Dispira simplex]